MGLVEFDFVHLLDENLLYHAEMKNEVCNVTLLNCNKEKVIVTYPGNVAKGYIQKGLWVIKKIFR